MPFTLPYIYRMKKLTLLAALAVIALSSCTKEPAEVLSEVQDNTPTTFEPLFSFKVDGINHSAQVAPDVLYTSDSINGTSFIIYGTFDVDSTHNTLGLSFNHIDLTPGTTYLLKTINPKNSYAYYTEQVDGVSKWSHSHSKDQGSMKIDSIVNDVLHATFQLNTYSDIDSTFTHSITEGHIRLRLKQMR